MKAPFPWFGGKSRISSLIWRRFGDVPNYVEPFFGSGAVLLNRPGWKPGVMQWVETVNDKDGFCPTLWRAVQHCPVQSSPACCGGCRGVRMVDMGMEEEQKRSRTREKSLIFSDYLPDQPASVQFALDP